MAEFTRMTMVEKGNNTTTPSSGFSFENVHRNAMILENQTKASSTAATGPAAAASSALSGKFPTPMKTGTTISGIVYKDGIVLGCDTRSTDDAGVADKNCEKIMYMAPNIYCAGAGTAADMEKLTELMSSQLELLRMNLGGGIQSRVVTACKLLSQRLFRYQGNISAALILGGCDIKGPHLYQIYPHGSTAKLPYTTMGSGSLAAMAVFETGWTPNMSEADAISLVQRSIMAGVFNDLGSGSNCDICIIRTDGTVTMDRGSLILNDVKPLRDSIVRSELLNIRSGTTKVLSTEFIPSKNSNGGVGGGLTLEDVTVTEMET